MIHYYGDKFECNCVFLIQKLGVVFNISCQESTNRQKQRYRIFTKLIPVTPRRRQGTTPTDASTAMTANRPMSSAMRSNDGIDWPVHSLMLSFHDLRSLPLQRLPWRQTWPNHDSLRRLTLYSKSSWRPARISACCYAYSFVLCSLYDMSSILL